MSDDQEADLYPLVQKLDYLRGISVFRYQSAYIQVSICIYSGACTILYRYTFTFTSLKWGVTLGTFFGLHSFVRKRQLQPALMSWFASTTFLSFAIWMYFYTKYNFYQGSIYSFEDEESQKVEEIKFITKYLQWKNKLPPFHNYTQQQIFEMEEKRVRQLSEKNGKLNCILVGIDGRTFDQ